MGRQRSDSHGAARTPRPSRRIHEEPSPKLPELAGCPTCGASYRKGRWTWKVAPIGSYEHVCPACQRIEQDDPAGLLDVEGSFVGSHRVELVQLVRHVEEREKNEHPLKRIMAVRDTRAGFSVTVTDRKLAPSLGRALSNAYGGELKLPPTTSETGNLCRVRWRRDETRD